MATITNLEDLECWKQARETTKAVYKWTRGHSFSADYALRDQVRRAALSIVSNIAEGFGREGTREFMQALSVAKGSATEVVAQLYVALDQGYLTEQEFCALQSQVESTKGLIGGLMRYLMHCGVRGCKFKKQP